MADAEVNQNERLNVRLRCPRCRAILDISKVNPRLPFACGGCRFKTDVADCVVATQGARITPSLRFAMIFVPGMFMGWFFTFLEALIATAFSEWGSAFLAGLMVGLLCGTFALAVRAFTYDRKAPRAASCAVLAGCTLALGWWLREREGAAAVSETMMFVLDIMALFWLCLAIYNIFRIFKSLPPDAVAPVLEVDNLTA